MCFSFFVSKKLFINAFLLLRIKWYGRLCSVNIQRTMKIIRLVWTRYSINDLAWRKVNIKNKEDHLLLYLPWCQTMRVCCQTVDDRQLLRQAQESKLYYKSCWYVNNTIQTVKFCVTIRWNLQLLFSGSHKKNYF